MTAVDSHIEQFGLWWGFHKHLIHEMFGLLREQLGDNYLVDIESQLLLIPRFDQPTRLILPDVEIEQDSIHIRRRDLPDPDDPFGSRVVAVIELLSPTNKGLTGAADRRSFLTKRHSYLASIVSYTEIDLLQGGEHNLPQAVEPLESYPYRVWASQPQVQTRHHWGWGWKENEPLPSITLPLDYPNTHTLDLGFCYSQAHQHNRWPLRLQHVKE